MTLLDYIDGAEKPVKRRTRCELYRDKLPKTTHEFSTISITNNYFYGRDK